MSQNLRPTHEPDQLEVVPGAERQQLQGWVPDLAAEEELRKALDLAFDYRGDITITLKNGNVVDGYVFDRREGKSLADSFVRMMPAASHEKLSIAYADIAGLAFTGKDTAAGKRWENWVREYWQKRMAGENNISREPEKLE